MRGARQDGVALRDVVADLAALARHLVHEGGAARHEQHGEPTHVIIIVEVGNEHVGGLHFVRFGELGREELRDLLRQVHKLAVAEEIPLELAGEGALFGERRTSIVHTRAGSTQMRTHKRADGTGIEIELALAHHVHGGIEIENMQDGVIDLH
ncbi:Uncharacterised protein [Collinsella intestinalis]|nr:Uncharacterised protein [Collinsella intestinalis]